MARNSSCAAGDGKSGTIRTMDKKMNKINGKILKFQSSKFQKNFQGLTLENISSKKHLRQTLNRLKNDTALLHKLQKINKRPGTTKMSKKWKNKKMKLETEFFRNQNIEDFNNEKMDRQHAEIFYIIPPSNKYHVMKISEHFDRFFSL